MITAILGTIGAGKTMLLTYYGFIRKHFRNASIYSNYELGFDCFPVYEVNDFLNLGTPAPNVLLFDEIWMSMDSREGMSAANKFSSQGILLSRKVGLDVYATSQYFHQIDKRVRGITHKLQYPRIVAWDDMGRPIMLHVQEYDMGLRRWKKFPVCLLLPWDDELKYIPDYYNTKEITRRFMPEKINYELLVSRYKGLDCNKKGQLKTLIKLSEERDGRLITSVVAGEVADLILYERGRG